MNRGGEIQVKMRRSNYKFERISKLLRTIVGVCENVISITGQVPGGMNRE